MENGWKTEDGKWKTDSSPLCVVRKPWRARQAALPSSLSSSRLIQRFPQADFRTCRSPKVWPTLKSTGYGEAAQHCYVDEFKHRELLRRTRHYFSGTRAATKLAGRCAAGGSGLAKTAIT